MKEQDPAALVVVSCRVVDVLLTDFMWLDLL